MQRILGMRRMVCFLILAALLGVPKASHAISARAILNKLRSVDGAGSGLDADTVRGMTPDQIVAQMQAAIGQAAVQALSNVDLQIGTVPVASGYCACAQAACPAGEALMMCGGGVANDGTGYVTFLGSLPLPAVATCETCACTTGAAATSVSAGASCLR